MSDCFSTFECSFKLDDDAINLFETTAASARKAVENVWTCFERIGFAVDINDKSSDERFQVANVVGLLKPTDVRHVLADERCRVKIADRDRDFLPIAEDQNLAGKITAHNPAAAPFFDCLLMTDIGP
jgi:hypothetical protein